VKRTKILLQPSHGIIITWEENEWHYTVTNDHDGGDVNQEQQRWESSSHIMLVMVQALAPWYKR
jgi:hypothetical protein